MRLSHTPGIENVSMTTNGVLLPKMAADLKEAGLSRVNISLDTLDPAQFRQITRRGELQQTLDGIDALCGRVQPAEDQRGGRAQLLTRTTSRSRRLSIDRPAARAVHRIHARGESPAAMAAGLGQGRRRPARSCSRSSTSAPAPQGWTSWCRPAATARSGEAAALLRFPNAQGGGLHQPLSRPHYVDHAPAADAADSKLHTCLFSDDSGRAPAHVAPGQ